MISIFSILAIVIVFAFSIRLMLYFAAKQTPVFIYFLVFVAWTMAFGIVALIPYDVYLVFLTQAISGEKHNELLFILWKIVYWTVFALCWVFLPLTQYYAMAGDFSFLRRCQTALMRHLRTFLMMIVVFVIFIIYLGATGNLSQKTLPVFLVVISNVWGLFLIMVLLGYGLVVIPRRLWNKGNLEGYLRYYQFMATELEDCKIEARYSLEQVTKLICAAEKTLILSDPLMNYVEVMVAKVPEYILDQQRAQRPHENKESVAALGEITAKRLGLLHAQLKKALAEYSRTQSRWTSFLVKAFKHEDIVLNRDNPGKKIVSYLWKSPQGRFARQREVLEWVWHTRLNPILYRLCALISAILSIFVVLGEITLFIPTPVGVFPLMFESDHGNFGTQVLCSIPLMYILAAAYYSLFSLRMPGFYGIYGDNHTDPSNLLWCAAFLCKLTSPLSFNFLLFIKVSGTSFSDVMGIIDFVPVFGENFSEFFPMILLLFCALNLFQIYSRLLAWLGMSRFRFSDNSNEDKIQEGKMLLQKARVELERDFITIKTPGGNTVNYGGYTSKIRHDSLTKKLIDKQEREKSEEEVERERKGREEEKKEIEKESKKKPEEQREKKGKKTGEVEKKREEEEKQRQEEGKKRQEEGKKREEGKKTAKQSKPDRKSGPTETAPAARPASGATKPTGSFRDRMKQYYK